MEISQLDYYLEKENAFGVNIKSEDESYFAWVLLTKRKPIEKFFDRFSETEAPEEYKNQIQIKETPYQLWFAELKRDVFDNDKFPNNEDYRKNDNMYFNNLIEVEQFLQTININIDDLKWSSEIDFL